MRERGRKYGYGGRRATLVRSVFLFEKKGVERIENRVDLTCEKELIGLKNSLFES